MNQLLFAERNVDGFWPNPTAHGRTDGGYDGHFRGVVEGIEGDWTVSVKHTRAEDRVEALQGMLRRDFDRYRTGREWWLVTNAVLDPTQRDRLRAWARKKHHQKLVATDGNQVRERMRLHPAVGRRFGFGTSDGLRPPPAPVPLPASFEPLIDQIRAAVVSNSAVRGPIVVRDEPGGGAHLVLRSVADRLARDVAAIPLWVDPLDDTELAAVQQALATDIPDDPAGYVAFVPVPRGACSGGAVDRLLRKRVRVVTVSQDRGRGGLDVPRLSDLSEQQQWDWVERVAPQLGVGHRAAVLQVHRTAGDVFLAIGSEAMEPDRLVGRLVDPLEQRSREALALLLLALPLARPADPRLGIIAERTGCDAREVGRLLDRQELFRPTTTEPLTELHPAIDQWTEVSPARSGAVVARCGLGWQARSELTWSEALRFAQLGVDEVPLLRAMELAVERLKSPGVHATTAALKQLAQAADLTDGTAGVALLGAAAARDRAGRDVPFDDDPLAADMGPWYLRGQAVELWIMCLRQPDTVAEALDRLVAVLRTGERGVSVKRLEGSFGPRPWDNSAPRRALGWLEAERLDPTTAEVTVAACAPWTRPWVEDVGSFGWTVHLGRRRWNEASPEVADLRLLVVRLVERLLASNDPAIRSRGWDAAAQLWMAPGAHPKPPPIFAAALDRALDRALAFLDVPDWDERARVESMVVHLVGRLDRERVAAAIEQFRRDDPRYAGWALMTRGFDWVRDPSATAAVVRADTGWAEVFRSYAPTNPLHDPAAATWVERMAALPEAEAGVPDWLGRVAESRRRGGWGTDAPLTEWIRRRPELFEPLLFRHGWESIPPGAHALLLWAARPVFDEALQQPITVDPPIVGARAALARLMRTPSEVPADDAVALLGPFWLIVPADQRTGFLCQFARHPDHRVGERVLTQLTHWVSFEETGPTADDVAEVAQALFGSLDEEGAARRVVAVLGWTGQGELGHRRDAAWSALAPVMWRTPTAPYLAQEELETFLAATWAAGQESWWAALESHVAAGRDVPQHVVPHGFVDMNLA
ncbi:MAG: hypothetical protein ABMB14_11800, partial [Myxococcota bacterium]